MYDNAMGKKSLVRDHRCCVGQSKECSMDQLWEWRDIGLLGQEGNIKCREEKEGLARG